MLAILSRIIELAHRALNSNRDDYDTLKEIAAKAVSLLDTKQPMGTELFDAIARLTVTVALETVALREIGGVLHVYLVQRAPDDTAYPGQYHAPGSVLRPMESEADVIARLAIREYGTGVAGFRIIGNYNHPGEERGHFYTPVCLVELAGDPVNPHGGWHPVNGLPEPMVEHHRKVVIPAATAFWQVRRLIPDIVRLG